MASQRMLKDWTESDKVNSLSANAEVFFTRLIMKADDYGSFHGNPKLLKANLFPLRIDAVRDTDISRWTAECEKAGLILVYTASGKQYVRIIDFGQRLRNMRNKFPDPTPDSNPPQSAASCSETPPEEEEEEKRKKNTKKEEEPQQVAFPWDSEEFKKWWGMWITYKKEQHRETYKSTLTQQAALKKLNELAGGAEERACQIIEQSIANSWKGLFELKQSKNGTGVSKQGKQAEFAEYFKNKSRESGDAA